MAHSSFTCNPCLFVLTGFNLYQIEEELKKRWVLPYRWYKKQNDLWDRKTNFIYSVPTWKGLLDEIEKIKSVFPGEEEQFLNYAVNRWYNFNSAVAVEKVFTSLEGVSANMNERDRMVDFDLFGITFDHKTTVFPAAFPKSLKCTRENPKELISWLYKNQSQEQRKHFENRLFLIVYSGSGEHWKLKAEISWLRNIIENYVTTFEASQLKEFEFKAGKKVFSDIIWAVK